jgi:predicted metal-dependent hydrolase
MGLQEMTVMRSDTRYSEAIVARENLDFGLDESIPKHWFRGDAYKTRYLDALQVFFPDGERYFITSLRPFRDRITDPVLQKNVRDFMRQEAQHGIAHTRYNQLMQAQGIPVTELLAPEKARLDGYTRRFSPQFNLALTAGFEHFTAMLAFAFFSRAATASGAEKRMQALLAWHAIEEMEHKSVAFDVMQKVARVGYWRRAAAMLFACRVMVVAAYRFTDRFLEADGYGAWQRARLHLANFLWIYGPRRGVFGALAPMLLAYFKPGFHPTQLPTIHNYPHWLEAYERSGDPAVACEAMLAAAYR